MKVGDGEDCSVMSGMGVFGRGGVGLGVFSTGWLVSANSDKGASSVGTGRLHAPSSKTIKAIGRNL